MAARRPGRQREGRARRRHFRDRNPGDEPERQLDEGGTPAHPGQERWRPSAARRGERAARRAVPYRPLADAHREGRDGEIPLVPSGAEFKRSDRHHPPAKAPDHIQDIRRKACPHSKCRPFPLQLQDGQLERHHHNKAGKNRERQRNRIRLQGAIRRRTPRFRRYILVRQLQGN